MSLNERITHVVVYHSSLVEWFNKSPPVVDQLGCLPLSPPSRPFDPTEKSASVQILPKVSRKHCDDSMCVWGWVCVCVCVCLPVAALCVCVYVCVCRYVTACVCVGVLVLVCDAVCVCVGVCVCVSVCMCLIESNKSLCPILPPVSTKHFVKYDCSWSERLINLT